MPSTPHDARVPGDASEPSDFATFGTVSIPGQAALVGGASVFATPVRLVYRVSFGDDVDTESHVVHLDDWAAAARAGESLRARQLCAATPIYAGLDYRDHVVVDERFLRPVDVDDLRGDSSKARALLGWEPTTSFDGLVRVMVDADLAATSRGATA